MMLKLLTVLALGLSGWAIGRARPVFNLPVLVLTLFAAVTAHSAMQWAFLEGRLDDVVGDPRTTAPAAAVVLIAAGEAVGLWVPFLVLPWTQFAPRLWSAVYALAASTLSAVFFYFPFDLVIVNEELIAPDGPPYLFGWFACLPIAAAGYLMGWSKSVREQADAGLDDIERVP